MIPISREWGHSGGYDGTRTKSLPYTVDSVGGGIGPFAAEDHLPGAPYIDEIAHRHSEQAKRPSTDLGPTDKHPGGLPDLRRGGDRFRVTG